ncbi:MAG: PQQ-binding-like beta-propeller repeat protein [Candidatus Bathyarchaeota archaeon]|nr:PQQ-binding-like beta-propeller repeat protein [Candidatus Bathyarchaeota archaeon]
MFEKIRQMKFLQRSTLITLLLMLTIAVPLVALPAANAHDPSWNITTTAFVAVVPDQVGVNQNVIVTFWLSEIPPTAAGAYGDRWVFFVDVTKPDGTTERLGGTDGFRSDPVGGAYTTYTPDQEGTYKFQAIFPGQDLLNDNPDPASSSRSVFIGDYYEPTTSPMVTLTVQHDPVPRNAGVPLPEPNQYWERPIYGENKNWGELGGSWLLSEAWGDASPFPTIQNRAAYGYQPCSKAPNTAHIIWNRETEFGGIIGGYLDPEQYYTGMSYEQKMFRPSVVINGILFYNEHPQGLARYGEEFQGVYAIDIRTGEELWYNPDFTVGLGQIYNYQSGNQHGGLAYLWDTTTSDWQCYDAFRGEWWYTIEDVPGGTKVFGEDGSVLRYQLTSNTLSLWNSSAIVDLLGGKTSSAAWQWRPYGKVVNGTDGIEWTVDVPEVPGQSIIIINDGVIVAHVIDTDTVYPFIATHVGYSATTGERLWIANHTTTNRWSPTMNGPAGASDGVYYLFDRDTITFTGYDIFTGEELWTSEPLDSAFDMYTRNFVSAYGLLYSASQSGHVYAINVTTGERVWTWDTESAGFETPFGYYPFLTNPTAADGKIFVINGDHSPSTPLFNGYRLWAIDVYTGENIWNISQYSGTYCPQFVVDGYLLSYNIYDEQIYCFGKGTTATTVSTQNFAAPLGTPVMIQGAVTDQSPGQTCLGVPAAGTAAISDDSMTEWMEYLYMQQPKPTDATGVSVHLTAIDPNGNFQDIGYATSNTLGNYAIDWVPPVPGLYTVTATFEGSESYYSSEAGTSFVVSEAAAPVVAPTTQAPAPTTAPTAPTSTPAPVQSIAPSPSEAPQPATTSAGTPTLTYIAIGAAVIIIVAVAATLILKRK